jgi:hypothetical protein
MVITVYLRTKGYTYWRLQSEYLFPKILFLYRDYTRKYKGKTGVWYYIFLVSGLLAFMGVPIELWVQISATHWSVKFVVIFTFFLIVPLLMVAVYQMSKEDYV